jgi:AraC-like DNA-binding protein
MDRNAKLILGERRMRARQDPLPGIPIGARSVEHVKLSRGRLIPPRKADIVMVKWGEAGEGRILVGDRRLPIRPGEVGIYLPGACPSFEAASAVWTLWFWTVDGPLAESFAREIGLRPGTFAMGAPPVAKLKGLMQALGDPSPPGERAASQLAIELLYQVAAGVQRIHPDPVVEEACRLIHGCWQQADFSVSQIADILGCHRTTACRRFRQAMGITMIDYLSRLRIQHATDLLRNSTLPVAEIAQRCGFRSATYFCRVFRDRTNQTPSEVRVAY